MQYTELFYFEEIFQSGSFLNWIGTKSLIIWPHYLIWKPNVKHFMMRIFFFFQLLVHHKKSKNCLWQNWKPMFLLLLPCSIPSHNKQYNIFNLVKHCLRCLLRWLCLSNISYFIIPVKFLQKITRRQMLAVWTGPKVQIGWKMLTNGLFSSYKIIFA